MKVISHVAIADSSKLEKNMHDRENTNSFSLRKAKIPNIQGSYKFGGSPVAQEPKEEKTFQKKVCFRLYSSRTSFAILKWQ